MASIIYSFYNNIVQTINDNSSNLYQNLSNEQKTMCNKQPHLRTVIIIQNRVSELKHVYFLFFLFVTI
jgi:hypothetical protein